MSDYKFIQFIKTSTPGPYEVPLKVAAMGRDSISFEIEIDDMIHVFDVKKKDIISDLPSESLEERLIEISPSAMSSLYSKICGVIKSEDNRFIL